MACTNNNCKCENQPCGCADTPIVTPLPCNPIGCPEPYPCSEITDAQCVIYTGTDLECGTDIVVGQNTNVANALAGVVDYFCEAIGTPNVALQEGTNINITSSVVGGVTTYTISADTVCPMTVKIEGTALVPRSIQATVTGGTAPYTYTWEMADFSASAGAIIESMILLSATPFPQVVQPGINLTYDGRTFDSNGIINAARVGLAKVTVTDANGCIARDTLFIVFTPSIG
jgi:hypothetical protein